MTEHEHEHEEPGTAAARDYELAVVAYRSAALVKQLLDSLPGLPAVVVDNSHGEDGLDGLIRDRPHTRYVDGPGRGFASAANVAVRSSSHEILVSVNPDCTPTVAQLDTLVAELDDPTVATVSATVTEPDGRVQLGVGGWEPTVARAVVQAVGAHKLFPRAGLWARPVPHEPLQLDWLTGTCSALRASTLLELGGFDESFFVYSEDVDYSRRARRAGYRQVLRTDVLVPHGHASSGDTPTRMLRFRGSSLARDLRRHHRGVESTAILAVLTGGSWARALAFALTGRRERARGHLAYARGMWSGPPPAN